MEAPLEGRIATAAEYREFAAAGKRPPGAKLRKSKRAAGVHGGGTCLLRRATERRALPGVMRLVGCYGCLRYRNGLPSGPAAPALAGSREGKGAFPALRRGRHERQPPSDSHFVKEVRNAANQRANDVHSSQAAL